MKWLGLIIGLAAFALGGLWFLQGIGAITLEPIACVGECAALEGPSLPWALAGAALAAAGAVLIWFSLRRRQDAAGPVPEAAQVFCHRAVTFSPLAR